MTLRIAIDHRLETARLAYPFAAGWADQTDVDLVPGMTSTRASDADVVLIDSISGLTMRDSWAIVADYAVAARRASMLTLATHTRPDDVDNVSVSVTGVAPAGRAVALATLRSFYGISVAEWTEEPAHVDDLHAIVSDGPSGLIPLEGDHIYQEDLGRAWFLMTNTPFVSHLCLARRAHLTRDPASVSAALNRLARAMEIGVERGRELRRNLSRDHGIDRDLLVEVLADQEWTLSPEGIEGLTQLARVSNLSTANIQRSVVRIGAPEKDQ